MALRLIGAGLPRTGTSSLRDALAHLLGGPVHHMRDVFAHPEHVPTWVAAIEGHPPAGEEFLTGYAAGVDTPFSSCWRELSAAYPDAPVLLSRRDGAETWWASFEPTVLDRVREVLAGGDPGAPMTQLFEVMLRDVVPDPRGPVDPVAIRAGYERRLAEVRAEIAPDRLVEWQPGDGWEPLCHALDLPVPDLPFPHENTRADFLARTAERRGEGPT